MYIDRETIIHACATLFVLCVLVFIGALALRIWQKRPRPAQQEQEVWVFDVAGFTHATLETGTYQREQALGNDVVRLNEYNAVTEGERVLEQYQARLESEKE